MATSSINLQSDKPQILYKTGVHWIKNIIPAIFSVIGLLAILIVICGLGGSIRYVALFLAILMIRGFMQLLENISTKVIINDHRQVIFEKGFFLKTSINVDLDRINGMVVQQNLLGSLLDYGTVSLTTAGIKENFTIQKPKELLSKIDSLRRHNTMILHSGFVPYQ